MSFSFQSAHTWHGVVLLAALLPLAGCGVNVTSPVEPAALTGHTIQGNVHGGVYPIQGATVRLMETQSNGYGGAAKQLLQTTSDSNGFFTFPDSGWTCDSNQFAYITVTSGHTAGNTVNNNVGQIGIIGNCGQFLATTSEVDAVQVYVSELSTVAAAYALRGFISVDNTNSTAGQQIFNISAPPNNNSPAGVCTYTAPVSCVAAGLAHGFENAFNLVDSVSFNGQLPSGQARTTPPTNSNAYVPQAMINTLANILQSCVDSPGGVVINADSYTPGASGSTHCGDLFFWATPPGGTAPTNTLEVALNMARYPTNNVNSLYSLQPRAVFFTPTLTGVPNDLSLSVFYLTEAFGANTGNLVNPVALTLDANDDVFVAATAAAGSANTQTAILGMATNGAVLFAGPVSTTYLLPNSMATDSLDNIWFTNSSPGTRGALLKANPQTGAISVGTLMAGASGLAVDRFNNVWASTDTTTTSAILMYSNARLSGGSITADLEADLLGANLSNLALDTSGNIWTVNNASAPTAAVVLPNLGTTAAPRYSLTMVSRSLAGKAGVGGAPGATGRMLFPLANQVDDGFYSGSGMTVNGQGTFTGASQNSATFGTPSQSEVDGDGSLFWTNFEANGQLFQYVPATGGTLSQGSLRSLRPCFPVNGACYVPAVSNARGMQIDSTGALWYVADSSYFGVPIGILVQTLGLGAPTWPQLSLGSPGVRPN